MQWRKQSITVTEKKKATRKMLKLHLPTFLFIDHLVLNTNENYKVTLALGLDLRTPTYNKPFRK